MLEVSIDPVFEPSILSSVTIPWLPVVKYMLLLRKCVMTCVSKHIKQGKENRRPSLCTTLANMTMANKTTAADATTFNNFTMIDNHITQYVQVSCLCDWAISNREIEKLIEILEVGNFSAVFCHKDFREITTIWLMLDIYFYRFVECTWVISREDFEYLATYYY